MYRRIIAGSTVRTCTINQNITLLCSLAQGLPIDAASAAKMKASADELTEEQALAHECITTA